MLHEILSRYLKAIEYDNTPHFPDIESYPHHKHTQRNVLAGTRPSISQVIEEALDEMNQA